MPIENHACQTLPQKIYLRIIEPLQEIFKILKYFKDKIFIIVRGTIIVKRHNDLLFFLL